MLNIVAGKENDASAILIRGVKGVSDPGRVGKALQLDKSFYGEDLSGSDWIWIEDSRVKPNFSTSPRIGINYAREPWISKLWRFLIED